MERMVEAPVSLKNRVSSGEATNNIETKPQIRDHRLHIITSEALGVCCDELSEKLGLDEKIVVDEILSVGYKSLKALADGSDRAVVFLKDGKLVVGSFKDKQ
jgi:hypothetical protein